MVIAPDRHLGGAWVAGWVARGVLRGARAAESAPKATDSATARSRSSLGAPARVDPTETGILRRSAFPVAARNQREHQWAFTAVLPEGHRLVPMDRR